MQTQQQPNKALAKTSGFMKKAYHLALCSNDGEISPVKCVVSIAVIAYVALVNPWLILAAIELLVIFSFLWFVFKLFIGQDNVQQP
mgnify:CR=1 FL=1